MIDQKDPLLDQKGMIDSYTGIVERYAEIREDYDSVAQLDALDRLLQRTFDNQKKRVLDVGCGDGLPVLKNLTERGYVGLGIDVTPAMVSAARENLVEYSNIQVEEMDIRRIGALEGKFDVVTAFYSLFHVDRRLHKWFLSDVASLLRKEGVLYASLGDDTLMRPKDGMRGMREWAAGNLSLPYSYHDIPFYALNVWGVGLERTPVQMTIEKLTVGGETLNWLLARKV